LPFIADAIGLSLGGRLSGGTGRDRGAGGTARIGGCVVFVPADMTVDSGSV
jgi:hypothetical protein